MPLIPKGVGRGSFHQYILWNPNRDHKIRKFNIILSEKNTDACTLSERNNKKCHRDKIAP